MSTVDFEHVIDIGLNFPLVEMTHEIINIFLMIFNEIEIFDKYKTMIAHAHNVLSLIFTSISRCIKRYT